MAKLAPFKKVLPYGPDSYSYWFSGIYKIVSYRKGEYLAYYLRDGDMNWGWKVAEPSHNGLHGGKCWPTLKAATKACAEHARHHTPMPASIKRASEIVAFYRQRDAA